MNHRHHLLGCGIAIIAGIVLVGVFGAPIGAIALLACPLMMIFMMGSHAHTSGEPHRTSADDPETSSPRSSSHGSQH